MTPPAAGDGAALWGPFSLSLGVSLLAILLVVAAGLPMALGLVRLPRRWSRPLEAVLLLPLVLPPSVTGLVLLYLLGRRGPVGMLTQALWGETLLFTRAAAVIASAVVAFPLFLRTARSALEAVPPEMINLARVLGDGPLRAAMRVQIPMARRGLTAGLALAFGRSMGEFGATLMVAGALPGTETLALTVYHRSMAGDDASAAAAGILLAAGSVLVLALVALMEAE